MDAEDLETLYQSLCKNHVAPNAMYLTGRTISELVLILKMGKIEHLQDDRGRPLVPDDLYCVTERGTFRVE